MEIGVSCLEGRVRGTSGAGLLTRGGKIRFNFQCVGCSSSSKGIICEVGTQRENSIKDTENLAVCFIKLLFLCSLVVKDTVSRD